MNWTTAALCASLSVGLIACGGGEKKAETQSSTAAKKEAAPSVDVAAAKKLMQDKLCLTCHSLDGSTEINGAPALGPTLKGIYGTQTTVVVNGAEVTHKVDDNYLRKSINEPMAEIKKGYNPVMAPLPMTPAEVDLVIAYIKTL